MATADPSAIWVLQAWFLVSSPLFWKTEQTQAFLNGVATEDLILLDLWAEVDPIWDDDLFLGKQFVWNMLHNYGGRSGMYATLPRVATGPITALQNGSANIVGTGFTPEAIETNPVAYDLMGEMRWRTTAPDLDLWVQSYAIRRYGIEIPELITAWSLLQNSVYNCERRQAGTSGSIVAARPDLVIPVVGCCAVTPLYWDPVDVCEAWTLMTQVANQLRDHPTFTYDLTTVTAQVLSTLMLGYHRSLVASFHEDTSITFEKAASKIESLIQDMDEILATQEKLLLGTWLEDAKQWAQTDDEWTNYQYNARLQITLWGPPLTHLNDYAYKLWSGLVSDFYLPRWDTFIGSLRDYIGHHEDWNLTAYRHEVSAVEEAWTLNTDDSNYPSTAQGNSVDVALSLYEKYKSECQ